MKIFENANLGNLILKNRLIRSATWKNLAEIDGSIDDKTYKIYYELAKGCVTYIVHKKNCKIISKLALCAFYKNSVEIPENNLSQVEIKYIIQNFISPACNKNENRIKILLEILNGSKNSDNLRRRLAKF